MTTAAHMEVRSYLAERKAKIDQLLDELLRSETTLPESIHRAMRYSVLGGGKRIRPLLALAAAEAVGGEIEPVARYASALELIHTYSLIHDDLPALDDDALRRGRATCHVVFGEAIAILTGDALLTEAFAILSTPDPRILPERQLLAIRTVARAIDSRGMIGGQVADLESERLHERAGDRGTLLGTLRFIHENKTGKLLTASVLLGGILGGASDQQIQLLDEFGRATGLAFQIVDDLLDEEESAETLGKTAGKDRAQGKLTYPAVVGAAEARQAVGELLARAESAAAMIGGPVNYLAPIARYICDRRS